MSLTHDIRHAAHREWRWLRWIPAVGILYLIWDATFSASHWYRLDRIFVADAVVGQPIHMEVDRTVVRDFEGAYSVKVRALPSRITICSGGSEVPYQTDGALPNPLTLAWWSYGAAPDCMSGLTPGQYELTTCVTIHPDLWLLGPRRACATSNVFTIHREEE